MPRGLGIAWLLLLVGGLNAQEKSAAPPYTPEAPVEGRLRLVGSTSMDGLAHQWMRGFRRIHPKSDLALEVSSSERSLPVLVRDKSSIAMVSRPATPEELARIGKQLGSVPKQIVVAEDVVVIIVHPENPVTHLTREQVRQILRKSDDVRWGTLGSMGDWANRPVVLHSRKEDSGTRQYVQGWGLQSGDEPRPAKEHESSAEVVAAVAADPTAIGYVSRSSVNEKVKVVALAAATGAIAISPTDDALEAGRYPLVRPLSLILRAAPAHDSKEIDAEFLRYVLSRKGQGDAERDGYIPLTRSGLAQQLDTLGWGTEK